MKIVVVGAGKVGYSLAQRLAQDQHDVYVIEKNGDRIKNLENNLDVNLVQGNGITNMIVVQMLPFVNDWVSIYSSTQKW